MQEAGRTSAVNGPLWGITVLDLSRTLSGPFCTMQLGDMGATVIKVEQPGEGDPARKWPPFLHSESTYFLSVNRNKKSVTLDFQKPEGQVLLKDLVKRADVFVENFKVGSLKRHGFDFNSLQRVNPGLIYCSITGFGQTGPRRHEPGFDIAIQAESGIMDLTGDPQGPPTKAGVSLTDIVAGLYAVQGILLALWAREKTGQGQLVDVALLDSALSMLTFQASAALATGLKPRRMGNYHPSLVPYESFAASDGYFTLGVGTNDMWRRLCNVLTPFGFENDPRFDTIKGRVKCREELHAKLQKILAGRDIAQWLCLFKEANIPCGRVNRVDEALSSEQVTSRAMVVELSHVTLGLLRQVGIPVKLSATPGSLRSAPPQLGEHNNEVYSGLLHLSAADLDHLQKQKVI